LAKLFFVGTSSGKTSIERFHSSILLSTNHTNLLIDAGDGISKALLSHSIKFNLIERIFITHLHPDHFSGLPALITQMKMSERDKDLYIYADSGILKVLESFILNSYLFSERLGFKINYIPVVHNEAFDVDNNLKILSRQNSHLNSVKRLINIYDQSFSSSSLLFNVENKSIHFTSDVGSSDDLKLFQDYKIDLLICELTHIRPDDILDHMLENPNLEKIIVTHINEENVALQEKYIGDFSPEFSNKVIFANDGLEIGL
jgi:ribonuclease Z